VASGYLVLSAKERMERSGHTLVVPSPVALEAAEAFSPSTGFSPPKLATARLH